jgi:23S rRNA (cytosine1962-C5)-methyltransferase
MNPPTLRLGAALADALAAGHPWIYRDHLPHERHPDGSWVRLEAGRVRAVGLWSSDGAIAVRVMRRGDAVPDRAFVQARIARALAQRSDAGLGSEGGSGGDTDAYRLLYGEGDGVPGVTIDRYGRYAVAKTYAAGYLTPGSDAHALLVDVARTLRTALGLRGVLHAPHDDAPLRALAGEMPPPEVTVREHGLAFLANLHTGQKTGLFLDHRENRAFVRRIAAGRRVANLFAYTGAFSVHALAGGAERAVDVDVAAAALHDATRNAQANRVAARHATLRLDLLGDPAAALRHEALAGSDLIVLDPPSLARNKGQRHAALRAYTRLNAAAMAALPAGGLLASASCTAQVSPEAFRGALAEAASRAQVDARVLHEAGHAADHPVPLAFPEGRYLKFVLLRIDPAS